METRQTTPVFPPTFSDLTVCNIHFWIWKYSKFIFMGSPLRSILVCKIPQVLAKSYRFRQLITLFQKEDEVTKNLYYVLSTRRSQIHIFRLQLMDYSSHLSWLKLQFSFSGTTNLIHLRINWKYADCWEVTEKCWKVADLKIIAMLSQNMTTYIFEQETLNILLE